MNHIQFPPIEFLISVADLKQLPADTGREIAFIGRSNAGKSSALNAITGNKKLAKTSKTPGRTQLINFFKINEQQRLVDLPGYGYAKVTHSIKERWENTLAQYFTIRQSLCGLVLLMDIRHPFKEMDQQMLNFAILHNLPVHILLTKADKLSSQAAQKILQNLQTTTQKYPATSVQLFSATQPLGIATARQQLLNWLNLF